MKIGSSIKLTKLKERVQEHLVGRQFLVKLEEVTEDDILIKKEVKIEHIQYLSWPDNSEPQNMPILNQILDLFSSHIKEEKALVHCTSGIGRTGTFIALNALRELVNAQQKANKIISVFSVVRRLRE